MRYQTISEYFYKLYSILFLIVLVPLGVFVFSYVATQLGKPVHPLAGSASSAFVAYGSVGVIVLDWIISVVFFNRSLRTVRTLAGLGERLDKYYSLTLVRFTLIVSGLLVLSIGFYLVGDQLLTGLFIVSLVALGFLWPFPSKVCSDLSLKESERRVIQDWK
jgi:hypothetical protein